MTIQTADLEQLRACQSSPVLTGDDGAYADAVRTWGPPSSPDVFVQPRNAEEIGTALRWAAESGVEVNLRSGAHGLWAPIPGGLMIDLGHFDHISVGDNSIVSIGPGATWGAVADTLGPHGLALSSGDQRGVGVGGNALGAGVGWLVRRVGFAVDQAVGAELVAADGRVVEVSESENPELFFAIRGGGGNFGVVTRLDFRATRLSTVLSGHTGIEPDDFAAAVKVIRDAMREAPDELTVIVQQPPPMGGPSSPLLEVVWAGDDARAAWAAVAPLLEAPGVGALDLQSVPYGSLLGELPPRPPGPPGRMTSSNGVYATLDDDTIDRAVTARNAGPAGMLEFRFLGGAVAKVPSDATALAWRDAEVLAHAMTPLPPGTTDEQFDEVVQTWAEVFAGADAICGTFTQQTGPQVVERMYPEATLARLRAVKQEWDPGNLFRRNHNIVPG